MKCLSRSRGLAIEILTRAQEEALQTRPAVGGFPQLAEVLHRAGVTRNVWHLPACQATYQTQHGNVVIPGTPLATGPLEIPRFDEPALIRALRENQAGKTTFPQFLAAAWAAGVVSYEVDFGSRRVTYLGFTGEAYVEKYPAVDL